MGKVNHINIPTKTGKIYCRQLNRIVLLNYEKLNCFSCKHFRGSGQGAGVECEYEDITTESTSERIHNPKELMKRFNK